MSVSVTNGLVFHLETDEGLTTSNGNVVSWADSSGQGNDLVAGGDPNLSANATPSGAPVVVLDGTGDVLERTQGLTALPTGNADRTIFFVVNYIDSQGVSAGLAYGDAATNQTFGLVSGNDNDLGLQAYGSGDADSNVDAPSQGWMIQSVTLSAGAFSHAVNGTIIDSGTHNFNTDLTKLVIGGEIGDLGESNLEVAAVLIYDRALTGQEQADVQTYLNDKYLVDDGLNNTPISVGDLAEVLLGGSVVIDVLANDIDDAVLDGSMITIVDGPAFGTIDSINPTTGEVIYTHNGSAAVADSFTYTITDANGAVSHEATVDISAGESVPLSLDGFTDESVLIRGDMNGSSPFFLPISMAFLPDNRMLLLSKDGEILIVDPETGANSVFMTLNNIDSGQERGLLDITLDPDFETNGHFYLYYTPGTPANAQIARFTYEENSGGLTSTGDLSSETTIWQDTDGYLACCHYGGGLDFGPDGKLWLTTADKFMASTPGEGASGGTDLPVDLTSSSGKIIRVNKDGSIPDGTDGWAANPFIDGEGGNDDSIWAFGLRNPFRARWDMEYEQFFIAEVGGNQQLIAHDDLHLASLDQAGAFYGWPFYEGSTDSYTNSGNSVYDPNAFPTADGDLANAAEGDYYSTPIWSLFHAGELFDGSNSASLTGGEVYRGDMFPDEWDGVYFYGDYTRDYIRYLVLDETGTEVLGDYAFKPSIELPGDTNEIVSINVGADGALYYALISSGEIRRVAFDGNQAPDINLADLTPLEGGLPLNVTFTANVTDNEDDAMTYVLNFGDGTIVNGSVGVDGNIAHNHSYLADGTYSVSLSVSDGSRTAFSQAFEVDAGDPNDAPEIANEAADTATAEAGITSVTFTADVSDMDGDALSYTWHFGDGSSASGTVPANGIVSEAHTYTSDGGYDAYLEVSDGQETTFSADVAVQVGDPVEVPVTDGLVLLLQSDIKIGLGSYNTVVAWLDGSGNGNNLFAEGDPQLLEDQTATGQPAIVFDGVDDLLARVDATTEIFNLPEGNANRTMFFVVDYDGADSVYAGASYGDAAGNETFGLVADNGSTLNVQGYGAGNDIDSGVNGVNGGFIVQSVVLEDDMVSHYRNGALIDSATHVFDTDVQKLILGGEIGGLGERAMKMGAVLIYDRALSPAETAQVEGFLQLKYITNLDPVAVDDVFTTDFETAIIGDVTESNGNAADTDANIGQTLTVSLDTDVSDGTLVLNADGSFTYTPEAGFFGTDSFTYVLADGNGGSDTATVTITVDEEPTHLPVVAGLVGSYSSDENVSLASGATVAGWLDGSGLGNDLIAGGDPTLVTDATPTGEAAIVFDGTGDLLQRIHATDSLTNLPTGNADRTIFFVVNYLDHEGVSAGVAYGDDAGNETFGLVSSWNDGDLELQGYGNAADKDSGVAAAPQGWMVQSVVLDDNAYAHYLNGTSIDSGTHSFATDLEKLVIGAEIGGLGESQLEVAAVYIYDRALDTQERMDVESFLQSKFIAAGPVAPDADDDSVTTQEDLAVSIDVLDNDSDANGDDLEITATTAASDGIVTIDDNGTAGDTTDDLITYTPNSGFTGTDSFTYTVEDGNGGSDTATVTVTVEAPLDLSQPPVTTGLVAAYESGLNVSTGTGNIVTGWGDSSGNGNDLLAAGDPTLLAAATPTGADALSFDGVGDFLERVNATDPLSGLSTGDGDRTLFFVVDYADNEGVSSGLVYGDGSSNDAFGVVSGWNNGNLQVQGWGGNNDFDSGVDGLAPSWIVQSVVLDDDDFAHYMDGALIDSGTHDFATGLDSLVIGREIAGLGEGQMDVAAAYIYDRALDTQDRADMETYLQQKFIDDEFTFA